MSRIGTLGLKKQWELSNFDGVEGINFVDDNGIGFFVDDNGIVFFTDDLGR